MDFIDSDSDTEGHEDSYMCVVYRELFKSIVQLRPSTKQRSEDASHTEIALNVLVIGTIEISDFLNNLSLIKLLRVQSIDSYEDLIASDCIDSDLFDVVVDTIHAYDCNSNTYDAEAYTSVVKRLYARITPGGILLTTEHTNSSNSVLNSAHLWTSSSTLDMSRDSLLTVPPASSAFISTDGSPLPSPYDHILLVHRKRLAICVNTTQALYWGSQGVSMESDGEADTGSLALERTFLESITVTPYVNQERLTALDKKKAAESLVEHGVCIIRSHFSKKMVLEWGEAALVDFQYAYDELKTSKGIDLDNPVEGQIINNFHELSMREARRVDLRNGLAIKRKIKSHPDAFRSDDIKSILDVVMNPEGPHAGGNWGRWNFNGGGPNAGPPPLTQGEPGAVISLPGCMDQTIHADTPHLCTLYHLPPHYINMFMIAADPHQQLRDDSNGTTGCECCDLRVGQTAFVMGSHMLPVTERLMTTGEAGEKELMLRLVRPHMKPGDVLLFDCRVLHFGLSNRSSGTCDSAVPASTNGTRRPIIYVNHHQTWFNDPKNWNDNEKLFPTN